jgi:hypothetical protein
MSGSAGGLPLSANPDLKIRDIRFDAIQVARGKIAYHIPAAFETN